ncbi:MAG TPA: hypothetical protein VG013_26285 [Gemmataceae bacterium]|nr:hypothetical protein [Gemmataceae bacterium]
MTEAEWLHCDDPQVMLEYLRGKVSSRKLRLFAVACCRQVWQFLAHEGSRKGVSVAERYADGLATELDRQAASAAVPACYSYGDEAPTDPRNIDVFGTEAVANALFGDGDHPSLPTYATTCAIAAARASANTLAYAAGVAAAADKEAASRTADYAYEAELRQRSKVVRDIFGNPFRPVVADAAWRTTKVVGVAQAIYGERAFGRMPELAAAFEEAGCTNHNVLQHCRQADSHARGCWVLDLILDKN